MSGKINDIRHERGLSQTWCDSEETLEPNGKKVVVDVKVISTDKMNLSFKEMD